MGVDKLVNDYVQTMINGQADAGTLSEVVSGDENTDVVTRLGQTYPTVKKAIKLMTQAGVGFTPFELKTEMSGSELVNGNYAIVTNDTTENNGLYKKKSGAWSKVSYDVDERQKEYVDTSSAAAQTVAISTAATDATTKANTALASSKTYADGVGSSALNQSKTYTDTAAAAALSQSKTYTDTAKTSAISTAAADATTKANAAQAAAIASAATDATTKADAAQSAAISTAKTDATTKANTALASAKTYTDTKAGEALTKANNAADMADAIDLTIKSITSSETDRVGDAPELFSDVIKAEPDPIILGSQLYISQIPTIGKVLTVKNKSGYVATRKAVPVYSGHSYSLSASLLRVVNPTDPLNDTIEVGVEWLNQAKQSISHQVIASLTLDSANGITVIDELIFPTATSAYVRAWFRIYGSDSETALIYLSANDITDAEKVTADITQSASTTLASAKTYTDTAKTEAVSDSKDYADDADAAVLSTAQDYADTSSGNAISTAAADATTKANTAQTAATNYADVADAEVLSESKSYTDDLGVESKESSDYVFAILDASDKVGFGLDKNGDITSPSIQRLEQETETLQDNIDNIGIEVSDSSIVFAIVDEDDNIGFSLAKDGSITNLSIQSLEAANVATNDRIDSLDFEPEVRVEPIKSDYMHLISYGQSLSVGSAARPVISTTQPYQNITWASGTTFRYDQAEHDYSSFKPLIEEQETAGWGETPISAFANNFVEYQVENGDSASNWVMLGSSPGQSGARINQIYKGTVAYSSLISQIEAAYALSQSLGKTYTVWSMAYTQGESDHNTNTYDGYYADLDKLYEDFSADSMAVTKQNFKPVMVTYQTSSHMRYNTLSMHVARAQLQLSKDNPNFVMATPIYYLPHAGDDVHLKAESSYHLGKCYAKALNYTLETGEKFEPLRPTDILSQGKLIHVTFNKSGLTFDTTIVAETYNKGFDIWSGETLVDTIVSVEIVDKNRVAITLSETPPDNSTLSYAKGREGDALKAGNIEGTRGNLRDSAGDDDNYVNRNGEVYYMHNWCVLFQDEINGSI